MVKTFESHYFIVILCYFICHIALCQYIQASKARDGTSPFISSTTEGKNKRKLRIHKALWFHLHMSLSLHFVPFDLLTFLRLD